MISLSVLDKTLCRLPQRIRHERHSEHLRCGEVDDAGRQSNSSDRTFYRHLATREMALTQGIPGQEGFLEKPIELGLEGERLY